MGLSLSEIAAARRAFIDEANIAALRKRTRSTARIRDRLALRCGFGGSSWSSSAV